MQYRRERAANKGRPDQRERGTSGAVRIANPIPVLRLQGITIALRLRPGDAHCVTWLALSPSP